MRPTAQGLMSSTAILATALLIFASCNVVRGALAAEEESTAANNTRTTTTIAPDTAAEIDPTSLPTSTDITVDGVPHRLARGAYVDYVAWCDGQQIPDIKACADAIRGRVGVLAPDDDGADGAAGAAPPCLPASATQQQRRRARGFSLVRCGRYRTLTWTTAPGLPCGGGAAGFLTALRSQQGEGEVETEVAIARRRQNLDTDDGTEATCRFRYFVDAAFRRAHSGGAGAGNGAALAAADAAVAAAFAGDGAA